MRRGTAVAVAPFALVAALAVGVALAGFIASPHVAGGPAPSLATKASATVVPTAAVSATPEATASPIAAGSAAPTSGPKSNDAAQMLRVHNELRAAVGAPAVRPDERVTAAAQHHAEYLARAGAIGHDETAGEPGFTGVSVSDRLAAQGYAGATAS